MSIQIKFTIMESTFSEDPLYVVSWKQFKKTRELHKREVNLSIETDCISKTIMLELIFH